VLEWQEKQVAYTEKWSATRSVLSPILYNIYTNDQPIPNDTRLFMYADDTAVAVQGSTFQEISQKLSNSLEVLAIYYDNNYLKPNPSKTQVCAFHLCSREAGVELDVTWRGDRLEHCKTPKYLGVTLDRTLSFKQHCLNTKAKVSTRNNIIRKLTNYTWGAQPTTLRTSAMALCISAAEYASPVWDSSSHAKQVDVAVNDTVRIVTGCLKPTPVEKIYPIAGIAPPKIRREVSAEAERAKQESDPRHPLFGYAQVNRRLKSRHSFMARTRALQQPKEESRLNRWRNELNGSQLVLREEIGSGHNLDYMVWRTLNRMRSGVPRCKTNMQKWGILPDGNTLCECGEIQDPEHLLTCEMLPVTCALEDVILANDKAVTVATYWKSSI
jgi:hypothetical protein